MNMELEEFTLKVYEEIESSAVLYSVKEGSKEKIIKELEGTLRGFFSNENLTEIPADSNEAQMYAKIYSKGFVHGVFRTKDYGFKNK